MNAIVTNTNTPQDLTKHDNVTDSYCILLADDDLEMRRMLAWSLRNQGYEVTECNDGDCLRKRLGLSGPLDEAETFDLIISDIRMPGVTGVQVLESAKGYGDFPPMILITAFGSETTHAKAKKLGAAAMLDKPFNIEDLLAKVVQILPFHPRSTQQQQVPPKGKTPIPQFPVDIVFRHECESDPVRDHVLGLAGKLDRFTPLIRHLHVVIDQSNPEEHRKHRYLVTLTAAGSGKTMVVKHKSDTDSRHENLYLAIQIAFGALCRQVKKHHNKPKSNQSHSGLTE